jgi:hypothetical protein
MHLQTLSCSQSMLISPDRESVLLIVNKPLMKPRLSVLHKKLRALKSMLRF